MKVLIVSLPGMSQRVLIETFRKHLDVEVVGVAVGCLSASSMVGQLQPDLVVIDSNLPEAETDQLVKRLKGESQRVTSLVLVETTQQVGRVARSGADIILRSYMLPQGLDEAIGNLKTGNAGVSVNPVN
jgi:DNA-binding NarL/FixJ family response regulator